MMVPFHPRFREPVVAWRNHAGGSRGQTLLTERGRQIRPRLPSGDGTGTVGSSVVPAGAEKMNCVSAELVASGWSHRQATAARPAAVRMSAMSAAAMPARRARGAASWDWCLRGAEARGGALFSGDVLIDDELGARDSVVAPLRDRVSRILLPEGVHVSWFDRVHHARHTNRMSPPATSLSCGACRRSTGSTRRDESHQSQADRDVPRPRQRAMRAVRSTRSKRSPAV